MTHNQINWKVALQYKIGRETNEVWRKKQMNKTNRSYEKKGANNYFNGSWARGDKKC